MRKGLTPVLATVLLMTISVGATASAYVFLTDVQEQAQESAKERLSEQRQEARTSINMEFVYNGTDGHTIFNLRNTGETTLVIQDENRKRLNVFVDGRPVGTGGRAWEYAADSVSPPVRLNPSQSRAINSTARFPSPQESQLLQVTGPSETRDAHTCYNSGANSC
jgi:archaellum component FlaF (FlaF/FlaG flagellin family)